MRVYRERVRELVCVNLAPTCNGFLLWEERKGMIGCTSCSVEFAGIVTRGTKKSIN